MIQIEIDLSALHKAQTEGTPSGRPGLVKKKVTVKRGGKTFQQYRWVKTGAEEPTKEKPTEEPAPKPKKELVIVGLNKPEPEKEEKLKEKPEDRPRPKPEPEKDIPSEKMDTKDIKGMNVQMEEYRKSLVGNEESEDNMFAVRGYTGGTYSEINQYLRDGKIIAWGEEEPRKPNKGEVKEIGDSISSISDFINTAPKVEGTVYRGMKWDMTDKGGEKSYNDFIQNIEVGKTIEIKNFSSTTPQKKVMEEFSPALRGHTRLTMEIETKNGVYLDGLSKYPKQHEILLDHNSKFEVIEFIPPTSRGKRGVLKLKEVSK